MTVKAMHAWVGLSDEAKEELKKLDTYEMNIFKLRDETQNNELVTVLMVTLAKRGILGNVH